MEDFPRRCPRCHKDLSVYSVIGARKHILRCTGQRTPIYTYRTPASERDI